MPSLFCEDCKSPVQWTAPGCAACGALFREIRCAACKYVGGVEKFPQYRCPRCGKEKFLTISRVDEAAADDVGNEAFVGDGALEDDIERSFKESGPKRPEPLKRIRAPESDKSTKPKEPADRATAPSEMKRDEPRPVLKRKKWRTEPDESESEADEKSPRKPSEAAEESPQAVEEAPRRSVRQQPVESVRPRRFHLELSPKSQQILRLSAIALPVLVVVVIAIVWLGGSGRGRPRRHNDTLATGVDPGTLEAEATRLYEAAVAYYRAGQTEQSLGALQEVVNRYPLTGVAGQARDAMDRIARGEAPFGDQGTQNSLAPSPESNQPPPNAPAEKTAEKRKPAIGIPIQPPPAAQPPPDAPDENVIIGSAPRDPRAPPPGSQLAKSDAKPRQLPPGFEAVSAAGVHSSGWAIEIRSVKDGTHMMLVPAGEFEMGNDGGDQNLRPAHRVALKTYYIDRFEITLGQYKRFLQQRQLEGNAYAPLSAAALAAVPTDRHPVVGVAWRDANAYAETTGKSLPSEAQWEKAARGSDARRHPWGNDQPMWEKPRVPKQLDRVGSFTWDVSQFGCYDMAGNAWEWCADWYDQNYYASSPHEEPEGPKTWLPPVQFTDPEKTLRGGSVDWIVAWRAPCGINEAPLNVGFRCVLNVERIPTLPPPPPVTASAPPPPAVQRQPAQSRVPPGGYKF